MAGYDESVLKNNLSEAEKHTARYEWPAALACLDKILRVLPKHKGALDSRRYVLAQQDAEDQIVETIGEARAAIEAERYDSALATLDRAQAQAAEKRILNHHAEIFSLRDAALERQRWQARVAADLKRVRELGGRKELKEALGILDTLLRDLTAAGLAGLGQAAREERDRLHGEGDLEDRLEDIDRTFGEQNMQLACELAEQLAHEFPDDGRVKAKQVTVCSPWQLFQRQLSQAEDAVKEGRLADVRGILGKLRSSYPRNPDWQALWQRAYLGDGQRLVSAGQQAVQGRTFEEAQAAFGAAAAAFGEVLAVFPEHASAGLAQAEAEALGETARWLAQAVRDQAARRWDTAREALRGAREQLAAAGDVRRQDFGDVKAVVTSLTGEVETAVEGLRRARALSSEGAAALAERAPDRAEKCYRDGLGLAGERDAALQAELLAGLQEATRVQREVSALVELAGRSTDAAEALGPLQQAHERWPDAPGLLGRLVEVLLAVAEAALAGGDENRAAAWSEQVLTLAGVSEEARARAQAIADGVSCKKQVAAALAEAARLQGQLDRAASPTAEGYGRLVAVLERAQESAAGCPEQLPEITPRLTEAQARWERLRQAERLLTEAEAWRGRGEWPRAVEALAAAAGALGPELAGRGVQQRQQAWGRVAAAIAAMLEKARGGLRQAQGLYEVAGTGNLTAVRWSELDAALDAADAALAARPPGADPLPLAWADLQGRVADLRARAGVVRKTRDEVQAGRPLQALMGLAAAAEQRPDDPVLAAVQGWLRKETAALSQTQAQRLLDEARALAEQGELGQALERLTQARELDVESADVTAELAWLDRQLMLLERLNRRAVVGRTKQVSNSPVEALDAFREVLQTAQDADSGLTDEVRTHLATLLLLETRLYQNEVWARADELVAALGQAGTKNRILMNHVLPSVRAWFDLATNKALTGYISSQQALGHYVEAYGAAKASLKANPDNMRIIQLATENRIAVQDQLLESAHKRLGRARELQKKGYFADALVELDDIEDKFLHQVRADHPEVIKFDQLDQVLADAITLQPELKKLAEIAAKLEPLVAAIRQAYRSGGEAGLTQVEQLIVQAELEDPGKTAKLVWAELDGLQGLIRSRRQRATAERIRGGLAGVDADLAIASDAAAIGAAQARLDSLRADLEGLPQEEAIALRKRVSEIAGVVKTRLEELDRVTAAEEKGRALEKQSDLEGSLAAFRRAALAARGVHRERLDGEVTRLESLLRRQQAMDEAWGAALAAIAAHEYDIALQRIAEASLKGKPEGEVESYRLTAQAGQLYLQAQQVAGRDLIVARRRLERALKLADQADCIPAATLRREIADALQDIANNEQALQRITSVLGAAEGALRRGDRATARTGLAGIEADLDSLSQESGLRSQVQALWLTLEAADQQAAEQFDTAIDLVEQALAQDGDLVSALRLKAQLLEEREVSDAVATARSLARDKRFSEASARLRVAQQKYPSQPRLEATRAEIKDVERRRLNEALAPARKAVSVKNYQAAAQEYARLIEQAGEDFKRELQQEQQRATEQWAEQMIGQARAALGRDQTVKDLLALKAVLQEVIAVEPAPSKQRLQELRNLAQDIDGKRLRQRLDEAQTALEKTDLELAEKIGLEVQGEVQDLDDLDLAMAAGRFNLAVQQLQQERLSRIRNEGLDRARKLLAEARVKKDLQAARNAVAQVLKVPEWARDNDARQLLDEIEAEIKSFDLTTEALEEARKRLPGGAAYQHVTDILGQVDQPSRLLHDEIQGLLQLASELQRAAEIQTAEPKEALEIYERAIAQQPTLLTPLQRAMNECRVGLLRGVLEQVDRLLDTAIPDHTAAQELLALAEQKKWVLPEWGRPVQERKTRTNWIMLTSQAGRSIQAEDYEAARRYLGEAMQLGRPEVEIAPYLRAVDAVSLLQRAQTVQDQDIVEARDLLRKVISMVTDFAPAKSLLERATNWLRAIERDVADLPLMEAQRFLTWARFQVEVLNDQSLLCRSNIPMWSEFSPLLLKVLLNCTMNVDKTKELRDHVKAVFGRTTNHVAVAMVDHQLAPHELQQIMSLRAQEGLTVVPVTRADLSVPERFSDADDWLLHQIELFAGKVDLLKITEPVADALSFFGREQILADLERRLLAGHPSIVFGVRKIGKSSLLKRMNTITSWPTASIDLEAHPANLGMAFLEAVQAWQRAMGLGRADLISAYTHPSGLSPQAFRQHVVTLLDALEGDPGHSGLVLLLDEAEYLFLAPDGLQFARILRSFKSETRYSQRFSLLAASKDPTLVNRTSIITGEDNPFYGFFVESPLGCLESEATKNMIKSIGLHMGINFDANALEELVFWSGGHPFLTRQLCGQVLGNRSGRRKVVDIESVRQALLDYSGWTGNYFRTCLWPPPPNSPVPIETALLCELASRQTLASDEWISTDLVGTEREERKRALDHLIDQSLVRRNQNAWELTIPLYGAWIRSEMLSLPSSFERRG